MMMGVPSMIYYNVSTNGTTGGTFRVVYARAWEYNGNWSTYDTTNKWSYSIQVVNPYYTTIKWNYSIQVVNPAQDITTPLLTVIVPPISTLQSVPSSTIPSFPTINSLCPTLQGCPAGATLNITVCQCQYKMGTQQNPLKSVDSANITYANVGD